jgi:hypothetical protein
MIAKLDSENSVDYLSRPLPCAMDEEISELIGLLVSLKLNERMAFCDRVKPFLLLAFSERMAILGVRRHAESDLLNGLMAHIIKDFGFDYRENLLLLSLLYHSASRIGSDPVDLFQKAAAFASPKSADYLLGFARKPSSIRSMGYKEVMTLDGFGYERTW